MLYVILTILKIIGIILLVILGIILFLILSILFVPVRYKGTIEFDKKDIKLNIKVSYFMNMVRFTLSFLENNVKYKFKILFFTLFPKKEKKNKVDLFEDEIEIDKTTKSDDTSVIENDNDSVDINHSISENHNVNISDNNNNSTSANVNASISNDVKTNEKVNEKTIEENVLNNKKTGIFQKIKSFFIKVRMLFEKIELFVKNFDSKIIEICDKLKQVSDKKDNIVNYLKEKESKDALNVLKTMCFKLLRHISPRKIKGNIEFGFSDPATTGQVYGFICLFYGVYGEKLLITPDFENEIMKGKLYVRGRIRIFTLLIIGIKLYRQKRLREMLSYIKR